MGPATGHGKEPDGERAYLDKKFVDLARTLTDAINTQHRDLRESIFGPSPVSIQSQITAIKESTIGDAPMSLRSQFVEFRNEVKTDKAVSRGKRDILIAVITFLFTVIGLKWKAVAAVILGTGPTLPMLGFTIPPIHDKWLYRQCMEFNVLMGQRWESCRVTLAFGWPRAVELAKRIFG